MKYLITAGGTGGHLYPALELANKLHEDNHEIIFCATNKKIDRNIIERFDPKFEVNFYNMSGFERKISLKNFINIFKFLYVFLKSFILVNKFKPDYVIGFGGYISFGFVASAIILKNKTAIHEQNSYPGLVNRTLSKKVNKVFYTYESSTKYLKNKNLIFTSNPRIDIVHETMKMKSDVLKVHDQNVLFIGGSLGAQKINDIAVSYANENPNIIVNLVTGDRYFDSYSKLDIPSNLRLLKYLNKPIEYFIRADYVITRAGATTLIELIASQCLTVVIPSPNVVANHQFMNANELEKQELITVINEDDLDVDKLQEKILFLDLNKQKFKKNLKQYSQIGSIDLIKKEINE